MKRIAWVRWAAVLVLPGAFACTKFKTPVQVDGGDGGGGLADAASHTTDGATESPADTSSEASADATVPICGNGSRETGESCDDGTLQNTGGYGKCNPNCTRGSYCGDDITNGPDEACDDGVNNGTGLDACNPACTGRVKQKNIKIYTLFRITSGNLTNDWDPFCMTQFGMEYKALIVDGLTRIASKTPFLGDGQVDWVLKPYTRYVDSSGDLVWTTDQVALLGVRGGQGVPLLAGFGSDAYAWAGFERDWTTSSFTCGRWSVSTGGGGTALALGAPGIVIIVTDCSSPGLLLACVEQ